MDDGAGDGAFLGDAAGEMAFFGDALGGAVAFEHKSTEAGGGV